MTTSTGAYYDDQRLTIAIDGNNYPFLAAAYFDATSDLDWDLFLDHWSSAGRVRLLAQPQGGLDGLAFTLDGLNRPKIAWTAPVAGTQDWGLQVRATW